MGRYTRPVRLKLTPATDEALDAVACELGLTRSETARMLLELSLEGASRDGDIPVAHERLFREFVVTRAVLYRTLALVGEKLGANEKYMVALIKTAEERGEQTADDLVADMRADVRRDRLRRTQQLRAAARR